MQQLVMQRFRRMKRRKNTGSPSFSVTENREEGGGEEGEKEEEEEENLIRLESIDGFGEVLNHVVRESEETLVASAARPKCQQSVSLPESHLVSSSDRSGLAFQRRYLRRGAPPCYVHDAAEASKAFCARDSPRPLPPPALSDSPVFPSWSAEIHLPLGINGGPSFPLALRVISDLRLIHLMQK